ncbi:hypothetical protein F53441_3254 [Fusarium austroafricanum]|uniref:WSC domain-containing protein n=1 Tax=Fusarium austroafricanum TaxID=2364996 RepID=A0A8H4KRH5_9HYPO|nr:hypothetical protein F53441_3254 [Fusarium austroafricanum]
MAFTKFAFLSLVSLAIAAKSGTQLPAEDPVPGQATSHGCFSALPDNYGTKDGGTFSTSGWCTKFCRTGGKAVAILHMNDCSCADVYPPKKSLVDDDKCDWPCAGYPMETCGGKAAYSVYNTGLEIDVKYEGGESKETTTKTASTAASEATAVSVKTTAPTTKSEENTTPVTQAEQASKTTDAASDTTAASTPSPSISTNNASRRLSSPIGNIIGIVRQLL